MTVHVSGIVLIIIFGLLVISHALHFTEWVLGRLSQLRVFIGVYLSRFNGFDFYGQSTARRTINGLRRVLILLFSAIVTVVALYLGVFLFLVGLCGVTINHPDTLLFAIVTIVVSLRFAIYASGEPLGQISSWLITCLVATLFFTELATIIRHLINAPGSQEGIESLLMKTLGSAGLASLQNALPNNLPNAITCFLMFLFLEMAMHGRSKEKYAAMAERASLGCVCLSRSPSSIPIIGRGKILQCTQDIVKSAESTIDWLTSTNDQQIVNALNEGTNGNVHIRVVSNKAQPTVSRVHDHYCCYLPITEGFIIVDGKRVLKTCGRLFDSTESSAPPHLGFFSEGLSEVVKYQEAFDHALNLSQLVQSKGQPSTGDDRVPSGRTK